MTNKLICGALLVAPLMVFAAEKENKHLRIHCDVNKTIICTDAVQNKGLEEAANGILSEFTFHNWDGKNTQSYYAFVTAVLAKDHPELPQASDEFKKKRGESLKEFPRFLEMFPKVLERYCADKEKIMTVLKEEKTVIFPSFFKLIAWLNTHYKDNYAIYLRTFGTDLPEIMPLIEKKSDLRFVDCGQFEGSMLSFAAQRAGLFSPTSYLDFFKATKQSYGIKDDYAHWKSKGFQSEGGKPFPVGLNAEDIDIFFDDNADDPVKPIICPVDSEGKLLNTAELIKKGIIVAVNPKEAILDEDYFIKKYRQELHKHPNRN